MRRVGVILLLFVAVLPLLATAATFYSATVSTTPVALYDPATVAGGVLPSSAFLTIKTAAITFRYDGVNPTESEGHEIPAGTGFTVTGIENVRKFRMVRATAVDASVKWTLE